MEERKKLASGKAPRSAMAPPSLRKALAFSPPKATIDVSTTTASSSSGKPHELISAAVEGSAPPLGPDSSPPSSAVTVESAEIVSSSFSSSGSASAAAKDGVQSEVPAAIAGEDAEAPSVAPGFLMWACSTVTSSSADDLSKKVAAAVLMALEDGAAVTAREGKGVGRMDALLCLAKVRVAVLCFLLLMSSLMLVFCLSSAGCGLGRDPYPPPT